jgi:hypothetical protein
MALIIKGGPRSSIQPGSTETIDKDGLINAQVTWEGDAGQIRGLRPIPNLSSHPYINGLLCYQSTLEYLKAGKAKVTGDYIGLLSDPSIPTVEFAGGSGQDPIETHPDFERFAGTPEEPLNGAEFDEDTGEFLGFFNGEFQGVRSYIVPSILVNISYYTHRRPSLQRLNEIIASPPGFVGPSSTKNYLRIGNPYRRTGNVYFVTEQYLGSGPAGWNRQIYG